MGSKGDGKEWEESITSYQHAPSHVAYLYISLSMHASKGVHYMECILHSGYDTHPAP